MDQINKPYISFHKVLGIVAIFFIGAGFIDGVTYWIFGSVGLLPIVYLPKIAVFACMMLQIFVWLKYGLPKQHLIITFLFLFFCIIGVLSQEYINRVPVGLNPFIPFLFGIIAYNGIFPKWEKSFAKLSFYVILLVSFGAFLDIFTNVPWKNFSANFGDISVQGSKVWEQGDFERVSGFTRISSCLGIQILACCLIYHIYGSNNFLKFFVWLLSLVIIFFSTAKTVLIVSAFFLGAFFVKFFVTRVKKKNFMRSLPLIACFIGILLPVLAYIFNFGERFGLNPYAIALLGSFFVRIFETWPRMINHVIKDGSFIFGTGIGSSSSVLSPYPDYFMVDNAYVWLFGVMGLTFIPLLLLWIKYIRKLEIFESKRDMFFLFFAIFFFVNGITDNSEDNPILSFITGLSLSHFRYRNYAKTINNNS